MEKIASCIKERGNWGSALTKELRFDSELYNPDKVRALLASASPKLHTLVQKIKELDAKDMKEHGRVYKHFIYSDIKSGYGAKLIASILQAHDFEHAYRLKKTTRGMSFALDLKKKDAFKTFAILTSVAFFEKPIGVTFRRELLKTFNDRPSNIYGEKIRIMVLDSGFREGLDLFDIKYVHVVEPITTLNDQKQAVGRATRFCGQKGLKFDPVRGWPLHVFRYETTVPAEIKEYLEKQLPEIAPADDFFQMFLKFSNIDPKKIAFSNELERVAIDNAVDKEYTKALHEFKVAGGGGGRGSKKDYIWPPVKVENLCLDAAAAPASSGSRSASASASVSEIAPAPGKAAATAQPAGQVVTFSPTQNFIREYFTPANPLHGMLLFHSIGTGKTCTAIATASSSFEAEDYSIMYVTRYTLKPDVWKNMFGQVCSVVVQDYLRKNKKLPESHAARVRLISKKWMEPMSYRQLSNTLDGKNKLHDILVKNNGKKDPLHKTLLIIDEAHKLFAADVEGQEKADIDVIKKALQHSYATSGKDSVKVLMMTATPYTSDAMDMIRVMNLILKKPLPEDFDQFSTEFLNEEGKFSAAGLVKFRAQMEGSVSYLNREKDIRSFAYPVFHEIRVAMSDYEFKDTIADYLDYKQVVTSKIKDYENDANYVKIDAIKHRRILEEVYNIIYKEKEKAIDECVKKSQMKEEFAELKTYLQKLLKKCMDSKADCKKRLQKEYKDYGKALRAELKDLAKQATAEEKKALKAEYKIKLANLDIDKDYDLQDCNKDIDVVQCEKDAHQEFESKTLAMGEKKIRMVAKCDVLKEEFKTLKSENVKTIDKRMEEHHKSATERLQHAENRVKGFRETLAEKNTQLQLQIESDVSQRSGLEKCLKTKNVVPAYKEMLRNDASINDELDIEGEGVNDEKLYLISGHGSETVTGFEKRVVMPKDKILVVFPECGRYNYLTTSCAFQDIFSNPKKRELLRNPIKHRQEIEKILGHSIRIYLPGEYVPNLTTNLFLNFDKEKVIIAKSGVFRSFPPMDRTVFKEGTARFNLGSDKCFKYSGVIDTPRDYTNAVHKQVFLGNIYPTASKGKSYRDLEGRSFPLMNIMEDIGIGIYYYTGCRYAYQLPQNYEAVLDKSEAQQEASKRIERIGSLEKKIHGVEEGKEGEGNEDDAISISRTPPRRISSSDKKNKKKPKPTKISPDEKLKLAAISEKVNELYDEITGDVKQIGKYTATRKAQIEKWRSALEELSSSPARKKIEAILDWMVVILTSDVEELDDAFQSEFIEQSKYIQVSFGYQFTKNKVKKIFYDHLYGIIPSNLLDEADKCTSTGLVKRIKMLFDKGVRIKLPTELKAWTDAQTKNICRETRTLLTTAK